MMRKKGDSQLISWVLLVGFVIGLATIVTMWVKNTAEQTTQQQIEQAEQELRCAETALNVAIECTTAPKDVKITNTGKFTIQKVKFRQGDILEDVARSIVPQQTETLNTKIDPFQEFDILPIISINGKEVVCATRKVIYQC